MLQISDFFGSYPDPNNQYFNSYIAQKEEFSELVPEIKEPIPPLGKGFKHQIFAVRYLTHYDRLMLVHEPGTGKSCIMVHSAELFKREFLKDPDDVTKIKKAVILVPNKILIHNIRNQIVCKCTDKIYITELVKRARDPKQMMSIIKKEVKQWYEILTYHKFVEKIKQFFGPSGRMEDLITYMSNKIFYIDEAHMIVNEDDIRNTQRQIEHEQPQSKYEYILKAIRMGKRNKLVLATATPMKNSPIDIIPLLNLLHDKNIPVWNETKFEQMTLEDIEPYLRGKISYIRALDTGAINVPQGEEITGYYTKIFPCSMSSFQYEVYLNITGTGESFHSAQKQISSFVFPDKSYGTDGFDKYIEERNGVWEFKDNDDGRLLQAYIRDPEWFNYLSAKFYNIVSLCTNSYVEDRATVTDAQGIVFVYFADFVKGGGAILLGLCLREYGYEEFTDTASVFRNDTRYQDKLNPCPSTTRIQGERELRIPKRRRYAILTGETDSVHINAIFNLLNSYENRYGEYLQVLIGSETAKVGININNAIKMIMAQGNWNETSNMQAIDRVFRSDSHVMRIEDKKMKTLSEDVIIEVQTYNMASIYDGDPDAQDEIFREPNYNIIDAQIYQHVENKEKAIKKMLRFIKQSAVDCYMNKKRNIRKTDIDYSDQCDFLPCDYQCAGIDLDIINNKDWTTKILFYSEDEVNSAIERIKDLFSTYYSLKLKQIYRKLNAKDKDQIFIDMALEKMIRENIKIINRMGFFSYLRESTNGIIYLERDMFELSSKPENTAYTSVLIGVQDPENDLFSDYVNSIRFILEKPSFDMFKNIDFNDETQKEQFIKYLNDLPLVLQANLFETAVYNREKEGITNDIYDNIISFFSYSLFRIKEPIQALKDAEVKMTQKQKRGRPRKTETKLKINKDYVLPYANSEQGEQIYIHTLMNQASFDRVSYNVIAKFINCADSLRVLKMSENIGWRDANQSEKFVYGSLISKQIMQTLQIFEAYKIYGIIIPPDNQFRIRDGDNEDPELVARDSRHKKEGRTCSSWDFDELFDLFFRLGKVFIDESKTYNKEEVIKYLKTQDIKRFKIEDFSDEELIHFYNWFNLGYNKIQICDYLLDIFKTEGRIFTGRIAGADMTRGSELGDINLGSYITLPNTET
ncbi:MAG: DEAD/DEAH box helicase family protein [Candidatus Micrarchaeaceae archaeon]